MMTAWILKEKAPLLRSGAALLFEKIPVSVFIYGVEQAIQFAVIVEFQGDLTFAFRVAFQHGFGAEKRAELILNLTQWLGQAVVGLGLFAAFAFVVFFHQVFHGAYGQPVAADLGQG